MQTEAIEMCTKWTQYPPDDFKGFGGTFSNKIINTAFKFKRRTTINLYRKLYLLNTKY